MSETATEVISDKTLEDKLKVELKDKSSDQVTGPTASMAGRRVDFGMAGEEGGLSWGIEVDIDITDSLARSRFQEYSFSIPKHVKTIKFLDLAPQEALPPKDRTVRSTLKPRSIRGGSGLISVATPAAPGNPTLDKVRDAFNLLRPADNERFKSLNAMVTWTFGSGNEGKQKFNEVLEKSKGDTLVIVHGHSSDLSGMGEQYPDETRDELGNLVQRKYNFVPIDDILNRYNDPSKFAAVVLHGCNTQQGLVEAKNVPIFYPMSAVNGNSNPGFPWQRSGGVSIPTEKL